MHKAVQFDIAEQYGYGIEVFVIGTKGSGRLDLYDGTCNAYYEVKHQPAASGISFENQMDKYDNSFVTGWRFAEYSLTGNVVRGEEYISGRTTYLYWDIRYWTAEDGVIVYRWQVNKSRYSQYMSTLVIAAGAMALSYLKGRLDGAPQGLDRHTLNY